MSNIFYLYNNSALLKTFAHLNAVVSYINTFTDKSLTEKFEIYVEEYKDGSETHIIKTLLYKNNVFEIDNIFNYY